MNHYYGHHYENLPMQHKDNFFSIKIRKFHCENFDTICLLKTLIVHGEAVLMRSHNLFLDQNNKKVNPCKPQFCVKKYGMGGGVTLYGHDFLMIQDIRCNQNFILVSFANGTF